MHVRGQAWPSACVVGGSPRAASWVECVLPQYVLPAVHSIGFMACPLGVVTMFAILCFPELEEPARYFPDLPLPGLVTRLPLGILSLTSAPVRAEPAGCEPGPSPQPSFQG